MGEQDTIANTTMAPVATVPLSHHSNNNNSNHAESTSGNATNLNVGSTSSIHQNRKVERPASKSRRMSSGGSRMAANGNEDGEGRNGYGRSSASDSSTEWYHATAADKLGSTATSIESRTYSSPSSSRAIDTNNSGDRRKMAEPNTPYLDLVTYPPQDLLRILAALLHQIASANDQLRPKNGESSEETSGSTNEESKSRHRERNAAPEQALATPSGSNADDLFGKTGDGSGEGADWLGDSSESGLSSSQLLLLQRIKPTTAALGALHTPSSTLCFRARNIPSISIEAYLLRILRYCPASCEVFVSLLVYFDRMSKMGQGNPERGSAANGRNNDGDTPSDTQQTGQEDDDGLFVGMRGFAIDSFNVHRLVIAGVTVASKFFSDVFYTNSRYAKVGGLPVHELNQLELQFLLLNDFNLMIPLEEMQRYANQLLVYGGASPDATRELVIPNDSNEKQKRTTTEAQPEPPVASTEPPPASPRMQPSDQQGDTTMGEG